jgi:hypothetical protein
MWGKILFQYYLIHHKSNTDWLGIELVPTRWNRLALKRMNHGAAPKFISEAPPLVSVAQQMICSLGVWKSKAGSD